MCPQTKQSSPLQILSHKKALQNEKKKKKKKALHYDQHLTNMYYAFLI